MTLLGLLASHTALLEQNSALDDILAESRQLVRDLQAARAAGADPTARVKQATEANTHHEKTLSKCIRTFETKIDHVAQRSVKLDALYPLETAECQELVSSMASGPAKSSLLNRAIVQDLIGQGHYELAGAIGEPLGCSDDAVANTVATMTPLVDLLADVEHDRLRSLLTWIADSSTELAKLDPMLEPRLLAYVRAHSDRDLDLAHVVAGKWYEQQLLRPQQLRVLDKPQLLALIRDTYARLNSVSVSPLAAVLDAADQATPALAKYAQLQQQQPHRVHSAHSAQRGVLPLELCVDQTHHPVFVCPVSRDEALPVAMPCGHMVSAESLQKLSRGRSFKCIYCPRTMNINECIPVDL